MIVYLEIEKRKEWISNSRLRRNVNNAYLIINCVIFHFIINELECETTIIYN